jgi:LDH2 family malate/lactate/ureidoglycolate dehydrogenase
MNDRNPTQLRVLLPVDEARELAERVLRRNGYDAEEARVLADHMLDAALCGYEYSGLPKILNTIEHPKAREPRTPMRALHETDVSVLYDGGNNTGMLTMYRATQAAIEKAGRRSFSVVGVTNTWTSGRSAYYVEMIARAGLIGIHTVSAEPHVAPPGGTRAALGTNPIAFGFPTAGNPLVIDIGTAAFMYSDLAYRARVGALLPEGVAIDAEGRPTRDPVAAQIGALLPFGGHKGYGLTLAMQVLGVFAGSGFNASRDYGYLIMAMKPDLLVPLEKFRQEVSELVARVKATPRQPGVEEIRIPSERSFRERARHLREGISIDRSIYDALLAAAER